MQPDPLLAHAAPRERVLDDHMFAVKGNGPTPATFRLQLFTASGSRPVAVATQTTGEGMSLYNAAERYANAVWQRHFPDLDAPPLWIQHQIMSADERDRVQLVQFTVTGQYSLASPRWLPISGEILQDLVGQPVDTSRGDGYVPRELEPVEELIYATAWVIWFPRTHPFRKPKCMPTGTPWWRRLGRQLVPRRTGQDCCWYHGGNWHKVNKRAIRFLRQAQRAGVATDELVGYVGGRASAEGITGWELKALDSLFSDPMGVQRAYGDWRRSYVNSQHRTQAMLDAGVRRTILVN